MSDVTLVNISMKNKFDDIIVNQLSTVGIYMIIAVLEKEGHDVHFFEHLLDHHNGLEEEIQLLMESLEESADVLGIGCHSVHLPFVLYAVDEIRKRWPGKKIILGNVGPSIIALELMEKFPNIDAVVVGEGEFTMSEIMERHKKGDAFDGIQGLIWRKKSGEIVDNGCRPRMRKLDDLPIPAYKYLDFEEYQQPMIITARGCPFGCPFCSLGQFWGPRCVYRSIDSVVEEILLLERKYKVKSIFIADASFVINRKRSMRICKRLQEEGTKLQLKCYGRLDLMDEELYGVLKETNFEIIFYGLESGAPAVLKKIKTGFTVEQAMDVVARSREFFPYVEVSMIWGFPQETLEDFHQTIECCRHVTEDLGCVAQLTWLQPYPGTPLYHEFKDKLMLPEDQSLMHRSSEAWEKVSSTLRRTGSRNYTIALRSMISAAQILDMRGDIIRENPLLFPDFYRYETPDLEEKLRIAERFTPN